jgi:membrane associated rhomboid family serine protease
MFVPLRYERIQSRHWPIVSMALILANVAVFFGTHQKIAGERPQRLGVHKHILLLAARHPELNMPGEVDSFVAHFQINYPAAWKQAAAPSRQPADAWDAKIRHTSNGAVLQQEMDALSEQFINLDGDSILDRYAFIPARPQASSYLTATFLHSTWLQLMLNMCFLLLAGVVLENNWGRTIYVVFYLLGGAAALQLQAWANPTSAVATMGASGAIAAVMGAVLARFARTKIEMIWPFGVHPFRFGAPLYWVVPIWVLLEAASGTLFGKMAGAAYGPHVITFAWGAVVALGVTYAGVGRNADEAMEPTALPAAAPSSSTSI